MLLQSDFNPAFLLKVPGRQGMDAAPLGRGSGQGAAIPPVSLLKRALLRPHPGVTSRDPWDQPRKLCFHRRFRYTPKLEKQACKTDLQV